MEVSVLVSGISSSFCKYLGETQLLSLVWGCFTPCGRCTVLVAKTGKLHRVANSNMRIFPWNIYVHLQRIASFKIACCPIRFSAKMCQNWQWNIKLNWSASIGKYYNSNGLHPMASLWDHSISLLQVFSQLHYSSQDCDIKSFERYFILHTGEMGKEIGIITLIILWFLIIECRLGNPQGFGSVLVSICIRFGTIIVLTMYTLVGFACR